MPSTPATPESGARAAKAELDPRGVQLAECLGVLVDRARLPGGRDEARADHTVDVDEERRAVGEALLGEEHAVLAGDLAVRPEVGEEGEVVALVLGERAQR